MRIHHPRNNWFPCVVATLVLSVPAASAQNTFETLAVVDPRPLGAAVMKLLERHSALMTYEDPRYEFAGDIRDVTREVRRGNPNSSNRRFAPRGGTLQASIEVFSESGRPVNISDAIQALVLATNASAVGGHFEVRRKGSVFHIVPTEARDASGAWVEQQSILDTPISLSTGEADGFALLEAILREVSETSGSRVGLAAQNFPKMLYRYRGAVQATNEPARDVLLRTMQSINPRLTWLLYKSPSLPFSVFNLAIAAEPPRPPS